MDDFRYSGVDTLDEPVTTTIVSKAQEEDDSCETHRTFPGAGPSFNLYKSCAGTLSIEIRCWTRSTTVSIFSIFHYALS